MRRGALDFLSLFLFFFLSCYLLAHFSRCTSKSRKIKICIFFFAKAALWLVCNLWKRTWKSDGSTVVLPDALLHFLKNKEKYPPARSKKQQKKNHAVPRTTFASYLSVNRKRRPRLESLVDISVSSEISLRWRVWRLSRLFFLFFEHAAAGKSPSFTHCRALPFVPNWTVLFPRPTSGAAASQTPNVALRE